MKPSVAFLLVAAAVALAVLALPMATTPTQAQNPTIADNGVQWELLRARTTSPGQIVKMDEGTLLQGIVVEAQARSASPGLAFDGTFRLTFDVFQPAHNLTAQKAGLYYVQGNWTISRNGASSQSLQARHSPDVIKGSIQAELNFNPALAADKWTALARLPMSPAAGRWARGQGTLDLDGQGSGSLVLDLKLGPASQLSQ